MWQHIHTYVWFSLANGYNAKRNETIEKQQQHRKTQSSLKQTRNNARRWLTNQKKSFDFNVASVYMLISVDDVRDRNPN